MKKFNVGIFVSLLTMSVFLSSCELAGNIFQAGMWVAVIGIVLVVAIIMWLVRKFRK